MSKEQERLVRDSWEVNAQAWTESVRGGQIQSRIAGTDQAIVSALASLPKGRLLDLGCGEGWLSREAAKQGWRVTGVDASEALIQRAREFPGPEYVVASYEKLEDRFGSFDCVVANFAILTEDVEGLLSIVRQVLDPTGVFVIQTVHPWIACADEPYENGWRVETFQDWPQRFESAMPWYFRTFGSWFNELAKAGLHVTEVREPCNPVSRRPLSLLLFSTPDSKTAV